VKKPSVTDLVGMLDKPALLSWANAQGLLGVKLNAVRQRVRGAGTSMHEQIETGCFDEPAHAENYIRFSRDKELLDSEKPIETEWFTGRYDARFRCRDGIYLIDYKKSQRRRVYFEHCLQLAAYGMAETADKFAIVATPDFAMIEVDVAAHREKYENILIALSKIYTLRWQIEHCG
jgi:hypothetical protein